MNPKFWLLALLMLGIPRLIWADDALAEQAAPPLAFELTTTKTGTFSIQIATKANTPIQIAWSASDNEFSVTPSANLIAYSKVYGSGTKTVRVYACAEDITIIRAHAMSITSMELSQLSNLWELDVPFNDIRGTIDLSQCMAMDRLILFDQHAANGGGTTSLSVGNARYISVDGATLAGTLDLSLAEDLEHLQGPLNALSQLIMPIRSGPNNTHPLEYVSMGENQISNTLDFSYFKELWFLSMANNEIAGFDMEGTEKLEQFHAFFNKISGLIDLRASVNLDKVNLSVQTPAVGGMDLRITDVRDLRADQAFVQHTVDLTHADRLEFLALQQNEIETLIPPSRAGQSASNPHPLEHVYLGVNQIANELDFSNFKLLEYLRVNNNAVPGLIVNGLESLWELNATSNIITGIVDLRDSDEVDKVFIASQHQGTGTQGGMDLLLTDVRFLWAGYAHIQHTMDLSGALRLLEAHISNNEIETLNLPNPASPSNNHPFKKLYGNANQISNAVDISNFPNLIFVHLISNQIPSITSTGLPALSYCNLAYNRLDGQVDFSSSLDLDQLLVSYQHQGTGTLGNIELLVYNTRVLRAEYGNVQNTLDLSDAEDIELLFVSSNPDLQSLILPTSIIINPSRPVVQVYASYCNFNATVLQDMATQLAAYNHHGGLVWVTGNPGATPWSPLSGPYNAYATLKNVQNYNVQPAI